MRIAFPLGPDQMQPQGPPTQQVLQLQQQGFSKNQVVQSLQRDGYNMHQISEAFNQAEIKQNLQAVPMSPAPPLDNPMQSNRYQNDDLDPQIVQKIEETTEAIIDEKWVELVENMKRVIDWKDKTEEKISKLEQKFTDLKDNFDKLQMAILEKVGEYDKHIVEVGTEVQALERVFQKILPGFMENVNELSRITEQLKKKN